MEFLQNSVVTQNLKTSKVGTKISKQHFNNNRKFSDFISDLFPKNNSYRHSEIEST